jgi:hypothetical protein
MSCACSPIDTDKRIINSVETFELSSSKEHGIDYVIQLNVIGLTGIILDSTKTKETVSRNKDMLVPPRQMKASLVVVRDDKVFGMSSLSKGLIQSIAAPSSIESSGKPTRKQRRYLAVWNSSKTNAHSSILFEADVSENSSCAPYNNFDLFIGLTAYIDSVTTTIPIGVASLPLAEAALLQGPSGKVVLDLPVYNLSPVQAASNNAVTKTFIGSDNSYEENRKNKRGFFSSFRKRQLTRNMIAVEPAVPTVPSVRTSKKPCIYTLDASQEDPAILRIELELHQKESNVEIGMSPIFYADPLMVDDSMKGNRSVVSSDVTNNDNFRIETSTNEMDCQGRQSPSMEQFIEDQSLERVLSIQAKRTTPVKSKFLLYPTRRFRVKCIEQTSTKFELAPKRKDYDDDEPVQQSSSVSEHLKELSSLDENVDINEDSPLELPIERVLSESPFVDDDVLIAALAQMNEEDISLQVNETPFDEKSFLSRDTTAHKSEQEKTSFKKSDDAIKTLKLPLFWRRRNKVKASEAGNLSSVAGTESSNHSSSNSESTSETPVQIFDNDLVNCNGDQLISVSSNAELICESPLKQAPVKFPVSILRTPSALKHKAKESASLLSMTSAKKLEDLDVFHILPAQTNNESSSVVSSSADTAILKKESPFEADKVREHRGDISSKRVIAKEASDSAQTLATSTTTQMSPYSNSLPHFVEETTKPIVLREKFEFDDDNDILKRKVMHSKMLNSREADCSPDGVSGQDKPVRNLAQNLYRFIDLQPCAGKIDPLIAIDDEDFTIAESWTHNENSTLGTFEPPKVTMHDDLADLGLLLDDMCRHSGFRNLQDDFSIMDDGTARDTIPVSLLDRNGGKNRWLAAVGSASKVFVDSRKISKGKTASRPPLAKADDDSDIEEQSLSIPSSDQSSETSADEQTIRSSTEESASLLSEQGTEVDVNDVNLNSSLPELISTEVDVNDVNLNSSLPELITEKAVRHHHAAKSPSSNLKSVSRKLLYEYGKNSDTKVSESTRNLPKTLSQSFTSSALKSGTGTSTIKTESAVPIKSISMTSRSSVSLPPKDPNRKIPPSQILSSVKTNNKLSLPDLGDESNGSRNDSLSPSRKSIAQSFVDFVEYVITPLPTSASTPSVPTLLDGDDEVSVGELTATTYERHVEVDEMRRQSTQQNSLPTGNILPAFSFEYFAEYDSGDSPEVMAALEAAAVKKLAESFNE